MSQQQIERVTLAALQAWCGQRSQESYKVFIERAKARGEYWGADETLDEVPNAL